MLSCKYFEIFKNNCFEEHLRTTASIIFQQFAKYELLSQLKVKVVSLVSWYEEQGNEYLEKIRPVSLFCVAVSLVFLC